MPVDAVQCLIEAVGARQLALLVVTSSTAQVGPVTTSYAVDDDGLVKLITVGPAGQEHVSRMTCTGPTVHDHRLSFATCSSPDLL